MVYWGITQGESLVVRITKFFRVTYKSKRENWENHKCTNLHVSIKGRGGQDFTMAEWLKDPEMFKELEKDQVKIQVDILKKQEGMSRSNISASIKE